MDAWPFQSDLTLTAMPRAAYWARRFAEEVLTEWKLDKSAEGVIASVLLVVTELTTNAVKATAEMTGEMSPDVRATYNEQPSAVSYLELATLGQVRLRLSYDDVRVLVEVWDASEAVPVLKEPDFLSESGRGLHLIETYCTRWGWYPSFEVERGRPETRRRRGKVVWGEALTSKE